MSDQSKSHPLRQFYEIEGMKFPQHRFSPFRVDQVMKDYEEAIHAFHVKMNDGILLPRQIGQVKNILDVGTRWGAWAMEAAETHKETSVIGMDFTPIQPYHAPMNSISYVVDANQRKWGWCNRFDYIRCCRMDGDIENWEVAFQAASVCQREGGFIEYSSDFYHPLDSAAVPYGIWCEWLQALDALRDVKGLSFDIDEKDRARQLETAGYNIKSLTKRAIEVKPGQFDHYGVDVLRGFFERMKGIFVRGLEQGRHPVNRRRELVCQLEEYVLQRGLLIEV
ncbi:Methyltransferase pytC [Cladobotryum mycophilum]|uniref:Methyltransferase pytC n=1 Tax=Cladobotryum mycophilum TaxID=491253 RepID=A0ABR0S8R3_9HYPO